MAHQAHAIPWQALIDNLKFKHCSPRHHGITNLYLRGTRPHQGKELHYFVGGFSRALSSYSAIERRKYDPHPAVPGLDDVVISEDAAKKLARTVLQYKTNPHGAPTSSLPDGVLSPYECTARRFAFDTHLCEGDMSDGIRDACEQTKTMLLYGEMAPLFRLAAHPSVHFYRLWDENTYANALGFGLSKLKDAALQAYICLNVIFLLPELHDPSSRTAFLNTEAKARRSTFPPALYDYRLTAAYQRMLLCCTGVPLGPKRFDVHTHPHREFFGVPRGMFDLESVDSTWTRQPRNIPGTRPVSDLVDDQFKRVHVASKTDVLDVLNVLKIKGLPVELALQVMSIARYRSEGRVSIRDDPLHPANAKELRKYLAFCWKILIRIDMLCKDSGQWLDWEAEATDVICKLFEMNSPGCRKVLKVTYDHAEFSGRTHKIVFKNRESSNVM